MNKEPAETIINDLRNYATLTGLLGGVCYVIGYLIMNFYLSRYGAHYASLVQARYFTTGFLYILLSALTASGPIVVWLVIRTGKYSRLQFFFLILGGVLMSLATLWGLGYALVRLPNILYGVPYYPTEIRRFLFMFNFGSSQMLLWFPVVVVFTFYKIGTIIRVKSSLPHETHAGSVLAIRTAATSFIIVLSLILSVYVYAIGAYSQIPTTFGGGAPKAVQLLLSNPDTVNGLSIKVEDGLSEPVILLDQSDRTLLIQEINGQRTLELSMSLILAIIHQK